MTQFTPEQQQLAEQLYFRMLVITPKGYGYYSVRADKIQEFRQLAAQESFETPEYAVLLQRGEGTPSAEEKQRIEERYHVSHGFEQSFLKLAGAA